ncbi:murein hydrolase activator EnvC family protein [Ilumatobacter sp.]|uniref:murein hydrolase activator EnvC family protein n=1 Tax=Ilumatobacter sp. TaxID=1967498 RepID=UPI003C41166B
MSRRILCALASCVVVLLVAAPTADAGPHSCWQPPVAGTVIDPFREPPCPYCAGNRGLEYRVGTRTPVRAVDSGVVSWAGQIAGTRYVVVRHPDGWRATYGRLDEPAVGTGDVVLAGRSIGIASGRFYFGLRRGEIYIDPAPLLGRLVGRPRLVPIDGSPAWPAPTPRLRCGPPQPPIA